MQELSNWVNLQHWIGKLKALLKPDQIEIEQWKEVVEKWNDLAKTVNELIQILLKCIYILLLLIFEEIQLINSVHCWNINIDFST